MNIIKKLLWVNKTVTSRIHNNKGYYIFLVGIGCISLILMGAVEYFFFKPHNTEDFRTSFSLLIFITIMYDIAMTLLKLSSKSFIEIKHLSVYPLSKWEKFKFYFIVILTDYKIFIYLILIFIFITFFLHRTLILAAFGSIILFMLLLITITIWIITAYYLFGKYFEKYRKNVGALIIFLFSGFFAGLILLNMLELINYVPIIGYVSNVLYGFMANDFYLVLNNTLLLLSCLLVGLFVYRFSPSNYW